MEYISIPAAAQKLGCAIILQAVSNIQTGTRHSRLDAIDFIEHSEELDTFCAWAGIEPHTVRHNCVEFAKDKVQGNLFEDQIL